MKIGLTYHTALDFERSRRHMRSARFVAMAVKGQAAELPPALMLYG